MKWWRYIYDERLPKGCKFIPACLSCPAACGWKKVHEKEILGYDRDAEIRELVELLTRDKKKSTK